MDQPALDSHETGPESLQALAGPCIKRLSSMETHFVYSALEVWLLRRLGIVPQSWLGRLAAWLIHFLLVLLPALLLTAATGQWASVPLLAWTILAAGYGGILSMGYAVMGSAIESFLSWVWSIADEGDLRRFVAWQHRWYNQRVYLPVSAVLTLGMVLSLYFLAFHGQGVPIHAGAIYIVAHVAFFSSQALFGLVLMAPEARFLSSLKHELYRLSPADSVDIRRSLRGYNQMGTLTIAVFTLLIPFLAVLLPGGSSVIVPIVVVLLLVEYVCTAVAVLVPRHMIERLIRAKKEEEMDILQRQLNNWLPRVGELTEEEREEMTQLQETHDAIRDSPENLLPIGAFVKVVGALVLSTLTVLATTFAEEWIAALAERFLP